MGEGQGVFANEGGIRVGEIRRVERKKWEGTGVSTGAAGITVVIIS